MTTENPIERPPLFINLMLEDGTPYEVKMTYGLFQDMQRVAPDPTALIEIVSLDAPARDYLVRRALTPSKKMITDTADLIAIEDCGLDDPGQYTLLLEWIMGHLFYFFGASAGGLKKLAEVLQSKLSVTPPPAPSPAGSAS